MHQNSRHSVVTNVLPAAWEVIHQHTAASHRALNAISWRHGIRSCTPTPHQKTSRSVRPTSPSWRVVTLAPTPGFFGRMEASAELTWLTNGIARFQVCKSRLCKYAVDGCHGVLQHQNSITAQPVAGMAMGETAVTAMRSNLNTVTYMSHLPKTPNVARSFCLNQAGCQFLHANIKVSSITSKLAILNCLHLPCAHIKQQPPLLMSVLQTECTVQPLLIMLVRLS